MANRQGDGISNKTNPGSSFKDPTADLSYTSLDGIVFKMHRKHIEVNAPDLPLPEAPMTDGNVGGKKSLCPSIALPESALVLDILFSFVRASSKNQKNLPPSLSELESCTLLEVAEASEKYAVVNALNVCLIQMKQLVKQKLYPLQIVDFADRHGYKSLADSAAVLCLSRQDSEVVEVLDGYDLLRRFLLFRDQYVTLKDKILNVLLQCKCYNSGEACSGISAVKLSYLSDVDQDLIKAATLPQIPYTCPSQTGSGRSICITQMNAKLPVLLTSGAKSLKRFSDITL